MISGWRPHETLPRGDSRQFCRGTWLYEYLREDVANASAMIPDILGGASFHLLLQISNNVMHYCTPNGHLGAERCRSCFQHVELRLTNGQCRLRVLAVSKRFAPETRDEAGL